MKFMKDYQMLNKYKIVKHYNSPTDYIYRLYTRIWFFFWEYTTAYSTVEQCEGYIKDKAYEKQAQLEFRKNTPKPVTVKVIG